MDKDTLPREQKKLAALLTVRLDNQSQIADTKHGCWQLILPAFDEVYYITLRDEEKFYKLVLPLFLLAHIADGISGLDIIVIVALLGKITNYW